jgi:hypothetical protein
MMIIIIILSLTVGLKVPDRYTCSKDIPFSVSAFLIKITFLLEVLQLLMLFVWTLTYLEPKFFTYIIFYTGTFLIIRILIVFNINSFIYFFPHRIMVGTIALSEFLLMSR